MGLLILAALPATAKPAPQTGNRFLFVVDVSSAMRGYSNTIVRNVAELLLSDMKGEFRKGDTLGLWTFDDKLHTEFPMEIWGMRSSQQILNDMGGFLIDQKYEKSARMDRVMPLMNQVMQTSERVTIVLISDGTGKIQGTPFDKELATLQKKYAHELRAAHVPFVLVLVGRDGVAADYTINYPGLIAIPHTALPDKIEPTNAPVVAKVEPVAPVPPPEPVQHPTHSIIMTRKTNSIPNVTPQQETLLIVHAPTPPPTPPIVPAPALGATNPGPVQIAVVTAAVPAPPPATTPAPLPTPVVAQPAPVAQVPPSEPPPEPIVPVAVAMVPTATSGSSALLFIAAFALLIIAAAFAVLLVRRNRTPPESSLISQSIDRR